MSCVCVCVKYVFSIGFDGAYCLLVLKWGELVSNSRGIEVNTV